MMPRTTCSFFSVLFAVVLASTTILSVLVAGFSGSSPQHASRRKVPTSSFLRRPPLGTTEVSAAGRPSSVRVWSSIDATDERDVNGAKLFQGTTESIFSNVTTAETVEATVNEEEKPPFPVILWRFTRPHTIIGSALAIPALHLLAAPSVEAALSTRNAVAVVYAMIPSLLMNLYITGLNQITDVEIDKVNKPDLPIAAGLLSRRDAIITVVTALVSSLWMGVAHPVYGTQGLNVALWGSGILGTLYSLWPFRLKRFPFLAAFCIVAVRGTIINASFFAHAKAAAFGDASATVLHCLRTDIRCLLSSLFFGIFGIVIALMKDVPDVRGDRMARVRTFSVRIGQKRVFHAMRRLLQGLFFAVGAGMVRLAAQVTTGPALKACRLITAASAVAAGLSVRKQSQDVDPEDSRQVYGFYMHLWKLFYLSYFALPFAR